MFCRPALLIVTSTASLSRSASSMPVTVTFCATLYIAGVNTSCGGATVAAPASDEAIVTVTSACGRNARVTPMVP